MRSTQIIVIISLTFGIAHINGDNCSQTALADLAEFMGKLTLSVDEADNAGLKTRWSGGSDPALTAMLKKHSKCFNHDQIKLREVLFDGEEDQKVERSRSLTSLFTKGQTFTNVKECHRYTLMACIDAPNGYFKCLQDHERNICAKVHEAHNVLLEVDDVSATRAEIDLVMQENNGCRAHNVNARAEVKCNSSSVANPMFFDLTVNTNELYVPLVPGKVQNCSVFLHYTGENRHGWCNDFGIVRIEKNLILTPSIPKFEVWAQSKSQLKVSVDKDLNKNEFAARIEIRKANQPIESYPLSDLEEDGILEIDDDCLSDCELCLIIESNQDQVYKECKKPYVSRTTMLLIITFVSLVVICLILIILLIVSLRRRKRDRTTNSLVTFNSSNSTEDNATQTSKVMNKQDLLRWFCHTLTLDLAKEFQNLTKASKSVHSHSTTTEEGQKWNKFTNKRMNRYKNILPFDDKRVELKEPINGTNYINASWVKGYSNMRFIATQTPLKSTVSYFWRMIVDYNINIVVNLDSGNIDGAAYWPPQGTKMELHDVEITLETTEQVSLKNSLIQLRTIKLTTVSRKTLMKEDRFVTQICFSGWPNPNGAPDDPRDFLALRQVILENKASQMNPIVVHCDDGIGATGTLIAMDLLAGEIESGEEKVDIYGTVYGLRRWRMGLIKNELQYRFLYQCVAHLFHLNYNIYESQNNNPC